MAGIEQKMLDLIFTSKHILLILGIFSVLMLLRWVPAIKKFLFSRQWKWLIAPINIGLSAFFIFVLGMTDFEHTGTQVMLVFIASAISTLAYEAVLKYIVRYLEVKIKKILNNN